MYQPFPKMICMGRYISVAAIHFSYRCESKLRLQNSKNLEFHKMLDFYCLFH